MNTKISATQTGTVVPMFSHCPRENVATLATSYNNVYVDWIFCNTLPGLFVAPPGLILVLIQMTTLLFVSRWPHFRLLADDHTFISEQINIFLSVSIWPHFNL